MNTNANDPTMSAVAIETGSYVQVIIVDININSRNIEFLICQVSSASMLSSSVCLQSKLYMIVE